MLQYNQRIFLPVIDVSQTMQILHRMSPLVHPLSDRKNAPVAGIFQLLLHRIPSEGILAPRFKTRNTRIHHAHRFLHGLLPCAPDAHNFADALHGTANFGRHAFELCQILDGLHKKTKYEQVVCLGVLNRSNRRFTDLPNEEFW